MTLNVMFQFLAFTRLTKLICNVYLNANVIHFAMCSSFSIKNCPTQFLPLLKLKLRLSSVGFKWL